MKNDIRHILLLFLVLLFTCPQIPLNAQKLKQQTTTGNNNSKKNKSNSSKTAKKRVESGQSGARKEISTIITSYPSGATVYINDAFAGYTPYTYKTVNTGYIKIDCSKSGFISQSRNVFVSQNQNINFDLNYQYKSIYITSNPSNAGLWINDHYVGSTPYTYQAKMGEDISITCSYAGYQKGYKTFKAYSDEKVNFSLVPEKSSQTSNYSNYNNYHRYNSGVDKSYPKNNFYIDAGIGSYFNKESWYSIASSLGFNVHNFNMQWDFNYGLDNTAIFMDIMLGYNNRIGRSKFAYQGGLGCYVYHSDYDDAHDAIGFALGIRYDYRLSKHLTFFANPVVVIGKSFPFKLSTGISFYL